MLNIGNIEKLKQLLKTEKRPRIVMARDDVFNRKIIEHGDFEVLKGIESPRRKMTLRQIDSGLTTFLASLMAKNGIIVGIDFENLREGGVEQRGILLAQIKQNIKICRKRHVGLALFNFRDRKDADSLLQSLGASSQQVKEALAF